MLLNANLILMLLNVTFVSSTGIELGSYKKKKKKKKS